MGQIVLIRPGRTEFDHQHRIQGSLNLPLSEAGLQDVSDLVELLRHRQLDFILSSTQDPALSTAQAISQELGINHKELSGLENLGQGLWEGLELQEVRDKFCKIYKQWEDNAESANSPQGEPIKDALDRIKKSLQKYLKKSQTFGIVVQDPLSSLVKQILTGEKQSFKCYCQDKCPKDLLETIPYNATSSTDSSIVKIMPDATPHHLFFF
jgi:broad specificity phosphatase PhoE